MSDGILTITGFGRFEKLHAEYNKLVVANQKLQDELRKVGKESKKTDDQQEKSSAKVVDGINQTIMGYARMLISIEAINTALQKKIELEQRAAAKSMSIADAQVEFSGALGLKVNADFRRKMIADVTKFGLGIGVQPEASLRGMAQVLNSVTDSDPNRRMKIAKEIFGATAPYFPNPEQANELGMTAAAIGDIHKGVPGARVNDIAKIAFGILGASRLSGPDKLATVGQAIVAGQTSSPDVVDKLENTRQMASIVSALGLRMGDADGELSRTAGSNLAVVFRQIAGDRFKTLPIGDAIRSAIKQDPKLIMEVKKKLLGKSFTKEAQKDLLMSGVTSVLEQVARGELDATDEELTAATDFNFTGTPEIRRARGLRIAAARQDAHNAAKRAHIGAIRAEIFGGEVGDQTVTGALESTGGMMDFVGDMARRALFEADLEMGRSPRDAGLSVLRHALRDMDEGFLGLDFNKRTESDRKILLEAIERISKMPAVIEENTAVIGNAQNAAAAASQRHAQSE